MKLSKCDNIWFIVIFAAFHRESGTPNTRKSVYWPEGFRVCANIGYFDYWINDVQQFPSSNEV